MLMTYVYSGKPTLVFQLFQFLVDPNSGFRNVIKMSFLQLVGSEVDRSLALEHYVV